MTGGAPDGCLASTWVTGAEKVAVAVVVLWVVAGGREKERMKEKEQEKVTATLNFFLYRKNST